jgi:hypothetical protein
VGDVSGESGRGLDAGAGEIVCGGESPTAVSEDADSNAGRFIARDLTGLAVLGAELAVATFDDADVGVSNAGALGGIERFEGELLHRSSIAGWWVVGGGGARIFLLFQIWQNEPNFARELASLRIGTRISREEHAAVEMGA